MRLLPRDTGFAGLASGLSLAIANYKPVPQLPTAAGANVAKTNGTSAQTINGNQFLPVTSDAGQAAQQSFQVQTQGDADSYLTQHPASEWGEPSVLYISNITSAKDSANQLSASGETVGPGKCPVADSYTPKGGAEALPPPVFADFDPVQATVYRYRQQQSVNLGSWFVQENWMEWNFFSCSVGSKASEWDVIRGFGTTPKGIRSARAYMEKHWDTWITEEDFANLAKIGINTVRIPIGYWSVGPTFTKDSVFEPYADVYYYSWRYVARAINWAAKYNIGVLVDLHGAYGSQNGQSHSGTADGKIEFFTQKNMDLTKNLLVWLANEISDVTNVVGIQLLNEPVMRNALWPWYNDTMNAMRKASPNAATIPLYFHDAFSMTKGAEFAASRKDFVVHDYHSYFVYTNNDKAMTAKQHTSAITGGFATNMQKQSNIGRRNMMVGEWSCALADSSLKNSKDKTGDQKAFCKAQEDVYRSATSGWHFWSYTMENCASNAGWCFKQAIKTYLPSSFDSWGQAQTTSTYFDKFNVSSRIYVPSLAQQISRIALPMPIASVKKVKTNQAVATTTTDDEGSDSSDVDEDADEAEDESDSDATYVNTAGILGVLGEKPSEVHSLNAEDDGARIGMVNTNAKRGVGSAAAQASEKVRRAAANSLLAARAGYNDGFKSVRYFAGADGSLSRLGFGTQYRADSYRARVAAGLMQSGNLGDYRRQYAAGLLAAEKLVAQTISTYKS